MYKQLSFLKLNKQQQLRMETFINTNQHLFIVAPCGLLGIFLMIISVIFGNRLYAQYKDYTNKKLASVRINPTTQLKGKSISYADKLNISAFETQGATNHRILIFWRMLFYVGLIFLAAAIVLGYAHKYQLINLLP